MFNLFKKPPTSTPLREESIHQSTEKFREAAQSLSDTVSSLREDFTTHNDFVRRIRGIYDLLNDPVMLIKRDGEILAVNQAFSDMMALPKHELEGGDVCQVFATATDCEIFIDELRGIPAGKVREYQATRGSGKNFICEVSVTEVTRGQNSVLFVVARDVTKRREREEEIRQQKEFFETVLDQLPVSVFIKKPNGDYLFMNKDMREELRRWDNDLCDDNIWDGEDLENVKNEDALLKMTGTPIRHETIRRGTHRFIGKTMVCLGEEQYISGFSLDIDEEVKSKKTLQDHEDRMRALYNHSPYGMVLMDREGKIILCNKSFTSMVQQRKIDLLNGDFNLLLAEEYREGWKDEMEELLSTDQDRAILTIELLTRTGTLPCKAYVMECDGSIDGAWFAVTIEDLRPLVKRDRQLDSVVNTLNHSTDGVLITDTVGKIVFVNDTLLARYGYERHEVMSQTPKMFQSGNHDNDLYTHLWDTISTGESWMGEIINRTKDGREVREMTVITPIPCGTDATHYMVIKKLL